MSYLRCLTALLAEVFPYWVKVVGDSFQHFTNSYTCTLTDQYYHCLSSNAAIFVSHNYPATGEPIVVTVMAESTTKTTVQPL